MNLYELKLGEHFWSSKMECNILRVPGGWLFRSYHPDTGNIVGSTFVPFSKEFKTNSEDGCTQPTASNTGSLQFPSLKEVREAYEKHMQQYTFSKEKNHIGVIEFVREYIITTCKQQAGA